MASDNAIDRDIDENEALLLAALISVNRKVAALVAQLEVNNGQLVPSQDNLDRALTMRTEIALAYAEYQAAAERVAQSYIDAAEAAAVALVAGYALQRQDTKLLYAMIADTRAQLLHYGTMNAAEVANAVYMAVVTDASRDELIARVDQLLIGMDNKGGLAGRAKTIATTNYMAIHNMVNKRIGMRMGAKKWLYKGTLIPESRPFCVARAGKVFTTEEVNGWNALSWAGKAGNAWTNCGGWNCRHTLRPFIETGAMP